MPPAGIQQTEMDEQMLLELEIQQELDRINLDDDNFEDDDDDIEVNNNEVFEIDPNAAGDNVFDLVDEDLPTEVQDYLDTIRKHREKLETELEECDAVMNASIQGEHYSESDSQLVQCDDWKAMEEMAAQEGLTVEEYRQKLLQDIENEPFELEEMDFITDDSEFQLPEFSLSASDLISDSVQDPEVLSGSQHSVGEAADGARELTARAGKQARRPEGELIPDLQHEENKKDKAKQNEGQQVLDCRERLKESAEDQQLVDQMITNENACHLEADELGEAALDGQADQMPCDGEEKGGTVAVVHGTPLLEFQQYLKERMQLTKEKFEQRERRLKNELECWRVEEKKLMLALEEQKLQILQTLQCEEEKLTQKKAASQQWLDDEIKKQQQALEIELKQHEEAMAELSARMQEDELELQKVQKEEEDRIFQRNSEAVLVIQRCYRGYRVRKCLAPERQLMAEKKEQRRQEKERHQIEEMEQKLQQQREEKLRQQEEARRKKEEEEKRLEEEKKRLEEEEKQKKEEEKRRQEELARQREEEQRRKEEERKRLKEEKERKRLAEEERKRKEKEEKKKKMEEENRKKEEEKRKKEEADRMKKEEENRKKEEEKRKKEEAERTKKEEEDRKKEEEKEKKEEAERMKKEEEDSKKEEEKRKQEEAERMNKEEDKREKEKKMKEDLGRRKEEYEEDKRPDENRKKQDNETKLRGVSRLAPDEAGRAADGTDNQIQSSGSWQTRAADGTDNQIQSPGSWQTRAADEKLVRGASENQTTASKELRSPGNQHPANGKSPRHIITLEPANCHNLPESLEKRRLDWMKNCLPWSKISNEPWKAKSGAGEKVPRRPASAKKLPPLSSDILLAAAQVTSLRQVTTVELCDLPGFSLSPVGNCVNLKHLKMRCCSLISLDSLLQCKQLQCIDVQENMIEYVDLKELNNLYTLNLAHNKLSSIHGMTGCGNLRWLDISHNRLTKLVGLSPLRRLHTLLVSDNQLVSTCGLGQCPTIQQLDLSVNFLSTVEELNKLALLISLNVASNNLSQMPSLENNVLLQELVLRENSIGPQLDLSASWLPLLCKLDLSQNIIEELTGSSSGLFVLKDLDLAVNQISEVNSFLPALCDCPRLKDLNLLGNVVLDEDNLRETVKNAIESLICLNGETLRCQTSTLKQSSRSFEMLCMAQLQLHKDIKLTFEKELRTSLLQSNMHLCENCFNFCCKSHKMAVEHRYTHEYGELSTAHIPSAPQTPQSTKPSSGLSPQPPKTSPPAASAAVVSEEAFAKQGDSSSSVVVEKKPGEMSHCGSSLSPVISPSPANILARRGKSPSPGLSAKEKFEMALRGETTRMDSKATEDCSHDTKPSVTTQNATSNSQISRELNAGKTLQISQQPDSSHVRHPTADGTQHSLEASARKFPLDIDQATSTVQSSIHHQNQLSEKGKCEHTLVNLTPSQSADQQDGDQSTASGINMTMRQDQGSASITADVVGGLMMLETAHHSSRIADSKNLGGDLDDLDNLEEMMEGLHFDIDGFLDLDQFVVDEDFFQKGWRPDEVTGVSEKIHPVNNASKPPLPPLSNPQTGFSHPASLPLGRPSQAWHNAQSPQSDVQVPVLRPPSSVTSGEDSQAHSIDRSRREDRLAEEWGFKDPRTAEMMVQRAKKMKYNAERRRKLSKLDPQQRLRLFRKLEQVKGVSSVRPPPARVLPRKEYFQAQEEEAQRREMEKQLEQKYRTGRTFEWLHTQVGDYTVYSSCINPSGCTKGMASDDSPPKTTSDSHLSQQSSALQPGHSSGSLDVEPNKNTYSQHPVQVLGQNMGTALSGQSIKFPPIRSVCSTPSQRTGEREKLSWRTEPVQKSVGWGGGRKRNVRK